MRTFKKREREKALERMLQTRSDAWAAVGLEIEVDRHEVRRASVRLVAWVLLMIAAVVAEQQALDHIRTLRLQHTNLHPYGTGWLVGKTPVTIAAVIVVLALGWLISRDLARVAPAFFKRMDPSTAGTVEFVTRLMSVSITILGALAVAGISLQALAVGGAFTAVVVGLAAQQTLGNLFAGMVLLSARPFRLGERIRLQAGALGGQLEGVVASLGLLYTTLAIGDDRMMIPNTMVLAASVVPVREPKSVDVRVRLGAGSLPSHVQDLLDQNISVPTRSEPNVVLEEIDGQDVIVRVQATPEHRADGAKLADQIIGALTAVTGEHLAVVEDVADD